MNLYASLVAWAESDYGRSCIGEAHPYHAPLAINATLDIETDASGKVVGIPAMVKLAEVDRRLSPSITRSGQKATPFIGCDNLVYLSGLPLSTKLKGAKADEARTKAAEAGDRWLNLMTDAATELGIPEMSAAVETIEGFRSGRFSWPQEFVSDGAVSAPLNVDIIVNGQRLVERPPVRQFWIDYISSLTKDEDGLCVGCGNHTKLTTRTSHFNAGGGHSAAITSTRSSFAEAWGIKRNGSICVPCDVLAAAAANYLLTSRDHSVKIGSSKAVEILAWWSPDDEITKVASFLMGQKKDDPGGNRVKEAIDALRSGHKVPLGQQDVHVLHLGNNMKRWMVLGFNSVTGAAFIDGIAAWSEARSEQDRGKTQRFSPRYLSRAIDARGKGDPLPDREQIRLMRQALGLDRRSKISDSVANRLQLQVIRLVLDRRGIPRRVVSLLRTHQGGSNMETAELWGRLFAVFEKVNYDSNEDGYRTSRLMRSAMDQPQQTHALTRPRIEHHLAEVKKRGEAYASPKKIADYSERILEAGGIPKRFTPAEKSAFILGYDAEQQRWTKKGEDIPNTDDNQSNQENTDD